MTSPTREKLGSWGWCNNLKYHSSLWPSTVHKQTHGIKISWVGVGEPYKKSVYKDSLGDDNGKKVEKHYFMYYTKFQNTHIICSMMFSVIFPVWCNWNDLSFLFLTGRIRTGKQICTCAAFRKRKWNRGRRFSGEFTAGLCVQQQLKIVRQFHRPLWRPDLNGFLGGCENPAPWGAAGGYLSCFWLVDSRYI